MNENAVIMKQAPESSQAESNMVSKHWEHWTYLPKTNEDGLPESFENIPESALLQQLPWYESPNPTQYLQEQLEQGRLAPEALPYLNQWVQEGYFVLSNLLPESDLEGFNKDLDKIWTTSSPLPADFPIFDVRLPNQEEPVSIPHPDLIANYTQQQRLEIESLSN
jgi:hypothetical protein